jgi:hypothetical protein
MAKVRIRVFTASNMRRSPVLRRMGHAAQRLGLDCEVMPELRYADCDVAVVWGLPKSDPGNSSKARERQKFRHDIFHRHSGSIVVVEAPVFGRRLKPRRHRPWLFEKLFPADARWAQALLPQPRPTLDPFSHYRIGLGGFPDEGGLALAPFCKGRWAQLSDRLGLPEIRPYRKEGRHIMVIGQISGDASLRGADINDWVMSTASDLRRMTDRPILVRPHRLARDFVNDGLLERLEGMGVKIHDPARPLEDSLKGAWSVVTYSSGAAVDALMAGVPAISISPASFAWEVTDHTLDRALDPTLHERGPWLEKLAAAHWCADEIANGDVWEPLLKAIAAENAPKGAAKAA